MKNTDAAHSLILTATKGVNRALQHVDGVLEQAGVAIERIEHDPVTTVEAADRVCPNPEEGLKTLFLKVKGRDQFALVVMRGQDRLDSKRAKQVLGGEVSFVDAGAASELLCCDPGAVAPISAVNAQVVVDPSVLRLSRVYFNPGANNLTYGISADALVRILQADGAIVESIVAVPKIARPQS
jgi:prolyl-tRNA editing enzyme YbaK/EbsC (Cys-tRNA(Pro) deacylase)